MWLEPVTLEGKKIRLEALGEKHVVDLWAVSEDPSIYAHKPYFMRSVDDMRVFVRKALQMHANGDRLAFATILQETGKPVGSTGYFAADEAHKRVEIGGTWVTPAWQRSVVNTETKFLLLGHAFETLGCNRVEFKTDVRNEKSRNALVRIGAKEEGVFRNHMVMPDGRLRDSVYYSIIVAEWPAVKARLREMMKPR